MQIERRVPPVLSRRGFVAGIGAGLAAASGSGAAWAQDDFASGRIVVRRRGAGPDLILIPGLASTADVWDRVADRLAGQRTLHLVSVRGFGPLAAGDNGDGGPLGLPIAREIDRYVRTRRLSRPDVIGHSMGGQIALRLAADAPGRVGRVMTVDASPFFPALISPGATVGDVEPIARIAYQALQFLGDEALRRGALGLDMGQAADAVFGSMGWQGGDRRVIAQGVYEVMTTDLRHRLPAIAAPVSVVYGWSRDENSPRAQADRMFRSVYASLRAPARFERIEGAEHMVMIDQPNRFLAAVDRFLG